MHTHTRTHTYTQTHTHKHTHTHTHTHIHTHAHARPQGTVRRTAGGGVWHIRPEQWQDPDPYGVLALPACLTSEAAAEPGDSKNVQGPSPSYKAEMTECCRVTYISVS